MAKIRAGALAGQISGSIGSNVFSHNAYGPYVRNRSIPTISTTSYAQAAKNRLIAASQAYGELTDEQKNAWVTWASINLVTDAFGEGQALSAHAAYVMLNCRILNAGGVQISVPPISDAPAALLTLVGTYDIGAGTFDVAFTATPLAANERLQIWSFVTDSNGRRYVKNLLKNITVSAAAQASPLDVETALALRFGTLSVGQTVYHEVQVVNDATGQVSGRLQASGVIVTT